MIGRGTLKPALVALSCLAAAGCAQATYETAQHAATAEQAATVPRPAPVAAAPAVAADAATPESAASAPVAPAADDASESSDDPEATANVELAPPSVSTAALPPAAPERPVVAPAAPATREPERAADLLASSAASPPSAEALDFTSLVTRLRKTKALNLRAKVAVKNESDTLLEQFRAYHAQHGTATLAELRRSYDSLFLKLHSLLEDTDPPLARDINRSRAAIWAILADPMKFGAAAPTASTRSVPPA